jgi:hypothetical protein
VNQVRCKATQLDERQDRDVLAGGKLNEKCCAKDGTNYLAYMVKPGGVVPRARPAWLARLRGSKQCFDFAATAPRPGTSTPILGIESASERRDQASLNIKNSYWKPFFRGLHELPCEDKV